MARWCGSWQRVAIAYFLLASVAWADQPLEVLTEDWAPFNYESNGHIVGYSTEVVKTVLKEAEIPFTIRMGVWKGVYQRALDEPNVLIYTITRTAEREDKFHWIGPIADRKQALYKLKQRDDVLVKNIHDAKNYRLVVQEQDAIATFFLNKGFSESNSNFQLFSKQILSLKMLFADRVDMIPSHPLTLKYEMAVQGFDDSKVVKVLDLEVEGAYYMAYSKGTQETLISRTQKAFEALSRDGTLESIRTRYSVE